MQQGVRPDREPTLLTLSLSLSSPLLCVLSFVDFVSKQERPQSHNNLLPYRVSNDTSPPPHVISSRIQHHIQQYKHTYSSVSDRDDRAWFRTLFVHALILHITFEPKNFRFVSNARSPSMMIRIVMLSIGCPIASVRKQTAMSSWIPRRWTTCSSNGMDQI